MQLIHQHGGDLDAIERKYGIPKNEIKDFSGNINPLGFPKIAERALAENLSIISTYPDKKYTALRQAISNYSGAATEHIVVGNGSTELISTFIQTVHAQQSIIIGPAYSEYEREVSLCGGTFSYFPLKEEDNFCINLPALLDALTADIGMLVICNPNNPTGTAFTTVQLEEVLLHCKKIGASVMIDETYIEFSDNLNEICAIPLAEKFDNLFVVRGTSKFFAAPGIRLGYGVSSNQSFLHRLITNQDPWSVNSLAAFAGEKIFSDKEFHTTTQTLISKERKKAFAELSTWKNIKAFPSSANFILLRLLTDKTTAAELFEKLIQKKMLIRDASSFTFLDESYLRFCILSPEDNAALLKEMKLWVE
ncbi:pyridoxal phosphate-dependent aminotransferase [Anaerotignum sp. MB30-C6]|uniref:pyridoxal phosphate-dependent aminotransferase n=1 Tax=Anaerotignum sp. MB30-C6 TaxID=3070814 RepID=UPI0027DBC0FD|nr:threonine-phosphate decarboxylase [Anaerotignum sp. MB30-C6]WMI81560.1 pyridoxal phosphate-dependent class II aminotransferase [Anaerotignum sp. MB30-C6]